MPCSSSMSHLPIISLTRLTDRAESWSRTANPRKTRSEMIDIVLAQSPQIKRGRHDVATLTDPLSGLVLELNRWTLLHVLCGTWKMA